MSLKQRLGQDPILVAPGVYDALTAALAEQAGFACLYLSGAAVSYTRLGQPDLGLASRDEMVSTMALIRERTALPVIMDADTGFGNALHAQRTLRLYERAGANALQIEDQQFPKRCGHLAGKTLIPPPEMAGKIRAMADARASAETLIIARTDAIAVEGFEPALERAELYLTAGADVLFIEAPHSLEQIHSIAARFQDRVPLLANMVEGGTTPLQTAHALEQAGFRLVIFPGGIVRALAKCADAYYRSLHQHGSNQAFMEHMFDFAGLNRCLGTEDMLAAGRRYDSDSPVRSGA